MTREQMINEAVRRWARVRGVSIALLGRWIERQNREGRLAVEMIREDCRGHFDKERPW